MTINRKSFLDRENEMHSSEASLTNDVRKWLELQTDLYWYKASDRYTKGVSDFIICINGIMVVAELKDDKGVPTAHQKLFIAGINKAGGIGGICYTLAEVKALVQAARNRKYIL